MKIVAIADTHCRHRSLRIPKGDILLHAGDISNEGSKREIEDFLQWFGGMPHPHKIFIAGNHDFFFEREKPAIVQKMIPAGVHYLKDEAITVEGLKIWGSPYTPRFYRWAFNKERGQSLAKHWEAVSADTDILLTHGPAYGILDLTENEQHAGDKELLKAVIKLKPKAHVCGHIHEAYGSQKKLGTKFINACVLNEANQLVHSPITFEV